jgi:hypothetical protein
MFWGNEADHDARPLSVILFSAAAGAVIASFTFLPTAQSLCRSYYASDSEKFRGRYLSHNCKYIVNCESVDPRCRTQ